MSHPFFVDIDPIAFSLGPLFGIGPLRVHWYGIMYLLAFGLGWWLGERRRSDGRLDITAEAFSDLVFYLMLGVIVGGRVGYMLFYDAAELLRDPLSLLRIWDGGMSFHGGLLGVLAATWWWCRRESRHFLDLMDFIAPLAPIGLGLGRLGNFIGGELWGRPSDLPWAMVFPRALELDPRYGGLSAVQLQRLYEDGLLDSAARHPSQLYEFLLEGVVLFAVLWWYSAKPRPRGAVAGLFALLYGVFRFAIEFVRQPDAQIGFLAFHWLTMGQLLSLPLIGVGLFLLWRSRRQPLAPQAASGQEPGR